MARLKAASALLVPFVSRASALRYQLVQEYNASNIFEEFNFFNGSDPTGGFVQYVSKEIAASTPLIGNSSDLIYIGVDSSNVYTPGGIGRPSVRLESKLTFTEGLFVIDLTHIPVGCGTWPALWTTGLSNWPTDGEIDVIENVNDARSNNAAIHATGNCIVDAATSQTGIWKSTDCSISHDNNQGCGTVFTEPYNYGAEFNANGGGIYAMEWTSDTIKIWFFPPNNVPLTLSNGGVPDSSTFGTPSSIFSGPCSGSFGEKLFNHSVVIDTTFCGGWAGGTFGTGSSLCPIKEGLSPTDSCVDFVASNPEAFKDAYWGIRSIKIWEKVPGFTVQDLSTPALALPLPVATMEPLDVLIKGPVSWNISTPLPTFEPLDVSPLTGGILHVGDDSEDTFDDYNNEDTLSDDDSTEDDVDKNFDAADDFIDLGSLADILDTEEPNGIIIDVDISPVTSAAAAGLDQAATPPYSGGISEETSASSATAPIMVPFGVGNNEGHTDPFPSELSLLLPTKGPRILAPDGDTGIVTPQRQQDPAPSVASDFQLPNTLPLLLPQPFDDAAHSSIDVPQIVTLETTVPQNAAFVPTTPVLDPQLNASALNVSAIDVAGTIVPPTMLPASGEDALLTPPKHSNPLIPAGIGNTGVVPPSIGESPILQLWSSFSPELRNKLIAAASTLPPPYPGSSPLTDIWTSLSPELKSEVLNTAQSLPVLTPENSVPTISDLINAASTGKVSSISNEPGLPAPDAPPIVKPAGGLLGFLDAKTKNKLKALFGQTAEPPTGSDDRKRQVPVAGPIGNAALATNLQSSPTGLFDSMISNALYQPAVNNLQPFSGLVQSITPNPPLQPVANNLQPLSGLVQSTVTNKLPQPVGPVLKLTPNVPVTALTSIDTTKAMTGLLSLLDDSTKDQIADLLLSEDTSATDVPQLPIDAVDGVTRRSDSDTMSVSVEGFQDASSFIYDHTLSEKNNPKESSGINRRETASIWTPRDKLALAQNVYALCPIPALMGIPFPSTSDLAVDLLDSSKTLEDATANFQRKLQAYFDITVQGCWTRINQWLAWRQLLSKPGIFHILPYPFPLPKRTTRFQVRQTDSVAVEDSDPQGLLEQQIYTICPKPDTFSTDQLIADLEDKTTSIEVAVGRFQNKLWAYMAKLQECSDKIRQYGPKLKALSGTPSTEPVSPITDHAETKRYHARQIVPSVISTTDLLNHLAALQQNDIASENLPFHDPESIYEALLAGTSAGWPGNPRAKEQLQTQVFQSTQATAPQPLVSASIGSQNAGTSSPVGSGPILAPTDGAMQLGTLDDNGAQVPDGDDDIGDNGTGNDSFGNYGNAAPPEADTGNDSSGPGNNPFAGSLSDDGSVEAPADDGSQDTAFVEGGATVPGDINTPSEAPPAEPVPADDTGLAPETSLADSPNQDIASVEDVILLPLGSTGDVDPPFPIEPPGRFHSRILRNLVHFKRQEDQNGVIPDTEAPTNLDAILGPHGTLDPFGFLGPQIASPNTPTTTADPQDSSAVAEDTLYNLPDTAVDEASPDVDAALQAGDQDPFGQLTYSKDDVAEENAEQSWESQEFLGKLRHHEESEQSGKYLGDPKDVSDFVKKFYDGTQ